MPLADRMRMAASGVSVGGAVQYAVTFNNSTTVINAGSDAGIDDIPSGANFTVEAWIRPDSYGSSFGVAGIICKSNTGSSDGWMMDLRSGYGLRATVDCATTTAQSYSGTDELAADSNWHHIVMYYDDSGDRYIYLAVDGVWVVSYFSTRNAGNGAYVSDASQDLRIGNVRRDGVWRPFDGDIAWARISNNDRYSHETGFTPAAKDAPPAVDANTIEQWNLNDGAGVTAAAEVNASNNGTITDGSWVAL